MAKPPVRALTLGVAEPHPLPSEVLEGVASSLHHATAALTGAGYEVQTERLSTRPLLSDLSEWAPSAVVSYAADLQEALEHLGVPFCSVGPAMPNIGNGRTELLADVIASHTALSASALVATAEGGLDVRAARAAARTIARLAKETDEGFGNFRFAALACVGPGMPFFPAAYHSDAGTGPGSASNLTVALQGAGIVAEALEGGAELPEVTERVRDKLTEHAGPVVDLVEAQAVGLGLHFGGIDLSPAPHGQDSIAAAMELAGHGPIGGPGTLALVAAVTAGVQGTTLPTCGYCGLMLPVMEDVVLAKRWEEGRFGLDQLLVYSAVCGTGLDTIPLDGGCSTDDLVDIICDVASLALRQRKPLSARLLPVPGKMAGERTQFSSPYLVNTVIKPLRPVA
jgi:uncharacterized protein (UPF0210 family)